MSVVPTKNNILVVYIIKVNNSHDVYDWKNTMFCGFSVDAHCQLYYLLELLGPLWLVLECIIKTRHVVGVLVYSGMHGLHSAALDPHVGL